MIVRRDAAIDGELATTRDRVEAGVVDEWPPSTASRSPAARSRAMTQLVEADGTTTATEGLGVTIGANWIDDERLNPFALSSGRAPLAAGEAVIDENTAEDQGWAARRPDPRADQGRIRPS